MKIYRENGRQTMTIRFTAQVTMSFSKPSMDDFDSKYKATVTNFADHLMEGSIQTMATYKRKFEQKTRMKDIPFHIGG